MRASISDRDLRYVSQKRNLSLLYRKRFSEIIHETSLSNISYVSEKRTSDPARLLTGSEAIVMSFFVTRLKKVTHPRSKVDADLNWCRTLLCFCHLQLCSTTTEC